VVSRIRRNVPWETSAFPFRAIVLRVTPLQVLKDMFQIGKMSEGIVH
jgi:hypothetical protein